MSQETEDSLARLADRQRIKIEELLKQRDALLGAAKEVLEIISAFKDHSNVLHIVKNQLCIAISLCKVRGR